METRFKGRRPATVRLRPWTAATLCLALASCAGVLPGEAPPPLTTYTLDPPDAAAPAAGGANSDNILVVARPEAAPGYDTPQMAYTQTPYRLDYYAHHQWADTPARMLNPVLVDTLGSSGLFQAVLADPAPVDADLRLESQILKLQHAYENGQSAARFILRVNVYSVNQRRLIANRIFSASVTAPENTPYGGAVAANEAVARVLDQVVRFLREELASPPAGDDRR